MPPASVDRDFIGRDMERGALAGLSHSAAPAEAWVSGPDGSGKTLLLARALPGPRTLHFQVPDLPVVRIVEDMARLTGEVIGEELRSRSAGVLPRDATDPGWLSLLFGIVEEVEKTGRPLILILDGIEPLEGAGRPFREELGEFLGRIRSRKLPITVVLAARRKAALEALRGSEARPDLDLGLGGLPLRDAGWGHGATTAEEAFRHWAVFGTHPAHLPGRGEAGSDGGKGESLKDAVIRRILTPGGDLHDRPIRRMECLFQRPTRYSSLLRTLAMGPMDWGTLLGATPELERGGQLAPYLQRLEEAGLVRIERPVDAPASSRRRRYSLADPFLAFWYGLILPVRSLLDGSRGEEVWARYVEPGLAGHLARRLPEAAGEWMRAHARESLGFRAREVGALWGGDADFDVVSRLENGQVCYGLTPGIAEGEGSESMGSRMRERMRVTRYGIGREARAPIFFLPEGLDESDGALRREVARNPLAKVITLKALMGTEPPPDPDEAGRGRGIA